MTAIIRSLCIASVGACLRVVALGLAERVEVVAHVGTGAGRGIDRATKLSGSVITTNSWRGSVLIIRFQECQQPGTLLWRMLTYH